MNYIDIKKAKNVYSQGGNVIDYLKGIEKDDYELSKIIEVAYDLQAGSYINAFNENRESKVAYAKEVAGLLDLQVHDADTILNVGAGELWTISLVNHYLDKSLHRVYNLEISWSRLFKGLNFWNDWNKNNTEMVPMIADMLQIPLPSKSVDVTTSSHGLEPNGGQLRSIIQELFRVSKKKCVLFEPSYELASVEGKSRMDRLGYIKGVEVFVAELGGTVVSINLLENSSNPLNPSACFILEPPAFHESSSSKDNSFTVPGTDYPLEKKLGFYISKDTGMAFPELGGIPILKHDKAILATALTE